MGALRALLGRDGGAEGAQLRSEGGQIWRCSRVLCFPEVEVEAEFAQEFREKRRRGTLLFMISAALFYAFTFVMSDGPNRISHSHISSRVLCFGYVVGFGFSASLAAATWVCKLDEELATIVFLILIIVTLFTGNTFRVSRVFGGDMYQEYIADCDVAVCYDDTLLMLSLIGSTSTTIIYAALRVSKSWMLVIFTTAFYLLCGSFGLGPLRESYALLMCVVCCRSYTHERDFRRKWLENRRLRLEVELKKQRCEEQQRLLDEVSEQCDAMRMRSSIGKMRSKASLEPDRSRYQVPGHDHLLAHESHHLMSPQHGPSPLLSQYMWGRQADVELIKRMARRIRDADYGMREFFDNCLAAFPELELFHLADKDSCGPRDGHTEYQRTFGALFAVYWLLRLDLDGRRGLSYGCDAAWRIRAGAAGEDAERKESFFARMDWSLLQRLSDEALGDSLERIEAMLCLTAIHDIMKVSALTPTVLPQHAPYHAYEAGDRINDHDEALAYVLEHFPHLLPSFACLPERMRDVVPMTQTKIGFNHGWFVQAEGPPGAMLSSLKRVLKGASGIDLAFYFVHWLTDISGAEGTPLAGAEKLTRKFPLSVLVCFLWSMPYLQRLADHSETEVVQDYLKARFRERYPHQPLPEGPAAMATFRLSVRVQNSADFALEAFGVAPEVVRRLLSEEMSLTGVDGQAFRGSPGGGGPAFLVYYGPSLLQRSASLEEMRGALFVLACIYAGGRQLWPKAPGRAGVTVTLEVGQFISANTGVDSDSLGAADSQVWALVQHNDREAKLMLLSATGINDLVRRRASFVCMDLCSSSPTAEEELGGLARPAPAQTAAAEELDGYCTAWA